MRYFISIFLSVFSLAAFADNYFPRHVNPFGERTFIFSPVYHEWAAYDADGYRVAYGISNGGDRQCPTNAAESCLTPTGTFRVLRKGGAGCVSHEYKMPDGSPAPMPYCMMFHMGGESIHGSDYISDINGSHGCIRVQTPAAAWLSKYFIKIGTQVIVLPYANQ